MGSVTPCGSMSVSVTSSTSRFRRPSRQDPHPHASSALRAAAVGPALRSFGCLVGFRSIAYFLDLAVRTVQESLGHDDASATMIHTHVHAVFYGDGSGVWSRIGT